ncbi:MAG: retropepsin-like domain-containing protein [Bacteroidales bacterium]|nr:retropepsin-like domain-containing protein [Bacteroidales bacterium]
MKFFIPLQTVEPEEGNFHLMVTSVFADGKSGNWVVDTGASRTVFDKNDEEKYMISPDETDRLHTAGIGVNTVETALACMKSFSLGKMQVENLKVALIDLSHINKLYSNAANLQICGLLGGDFLMKYNAVIDYRRKVMVLKFS